MSNSVSNCNRGTEGVRQNLSGVPPQAWFRTRLGRRYGVEIALVLGAKLALLVLLWMVFIQPWPRSPTPPAAVVQTFYAPTAAASSHD